MEIQPATHRKKAFGDVAGLLSFLLAVIIGVLLINAFLFRTFSVEGASMESTLQEGDRLLVNRAPLTKAKITGKNYLPRRGEIVVFAGHRRTITAASSEFIVKRVIGLPGERVVVEDGVITVFNKEHLHGFQPDKDFVGPKSPTSGEIETIVPAGELFVAGDNRTGNHSLDSRNGLGTVKIDQIQGPVIMRIFPFEKIRMF